MITTLIRHQPSHITSSMLSSDICSSHYKIYGMIYQWMESGSPIGHGHQLICLIVIVIVIVISAKSTNFTTNTRYHVDSSVDEPHRLQQRVLVLVYLSFGVLMSFSSRSPGFLSSLTCSAPSFHIPSPCTSPGVLGSFPHC